MTEQDPTTLKLLAELQEVANRGGVVTHIVQDAWKIVDKEIQKPVEGEDD